MTVRTRQRLVGRARAGCVVPHRMPGRLLRLVRFRVSEGAVAAVRGNPLTDWFLGGLNHRIGHHLFPGSCRPHPRLAQPAVKDRCRDLGVPYAETGLVDSYRPALRHMHEVGEPLRADI